MRPALLGDVVPNATEGEEVTVENMSNASSKSRAEIISVASINASLQEHPALAGVNLTELSVFVSHIEVPEPGAKSVVGINRSHDNPEVCSAFSQPVFMFNSSSLIQKPSQTGLGSTTQCYQNGQPLNEAWCMQEQQNCEKCSGTWQGGSGPTPSTPMTSSGGSQLTVTPDANREKNYFLVIGDWGIYPGFTGGCQKAIATKMKAYASAQAAQGKKLLAIVSTGDNFYWTGLHADDPRWRTVWADIYGVNDPSSPLHNVPWIGNFGNHDYGTDDPQSLCGKSNQLSTSPSRPSGTSLFYMPAYNFHVEVPGIGLEFISVDTNAPYLGHKVETNDNGFAESTLSQCGGKQNVVNFLNKIYTEGKHLLRERASAGSATTTVLIQHYPSEYQSSLSAFSGGLNGRSTQVLSVYGHTHAQFCKPSFNGGSLESGGSDPSCDHILSGGGGGCCNYGGGSAVDGPLGFAAIHLKSDGGYTTKTTGSDVVVQSNECTI